MSNSNYYQHTTPSQPENEPEQNLDQDSDERSSRNWSRFLRRFFASPHHDPSLPRWKSFVVFMSVFVFAAVLGVLCIRFLPPVSPNGPLLRGGLIYNTDPLNQVGYSEVISFKVGLRTPTAMTTDSDGNILVAGDKKLIQYNIRENQNYNIYGDKEREFFIPETPVAILAPMPGELFAGNILCAGKNRIDVLDSSGKLLKSLTPFDADCWITAMAVNQDQLFVADCSKKVVYSLDENGSIQKTIGKGRTTSPEGDPFPGFVVPSPYFGLCCDSRQKLWVANPGMKQLVAFTPEGDWDQEFTWEKLEEAQDAFYGCCNPAAFAMLHNDRFVTAEKGVNRLKIFSSTGEFQCFVAPPSLFDSALAAFDNDTEPALDSLQQISQTTQENTSPSTPDKVLQLAILPDDQIIVLDPANRKIFVFRENEGSTPR